MSLGWISFLGQRRNANLDIVCMREMCRLASDSIFDLRYNLYCTKMKGKNAIGKTLDIGIDNIFLTNVRKIAANIDVHD